jgi:hypothetical protein
MFARLVRCKNSARHQFCVSLIMAAKDRHNLHLNIILTHHIVLSFELHSRAISLAKDVYSFYGCRIQARVTPSVTSLFLCAT